MKRPEIASAVLAFLKLNCAPEDFAWHRETLVVVRRPGRALLALCLVPCAAGKKPSAEERANHELLRAGGVRVVIVHSAAEAELALRGKLLDALRGRKVSLAAAAPVAVPARTSPPRHLGIPGALGEQRRGAAVGQLHNVAPRRWARHRGGRRIASAA